MPETDADRALLAVRELAEAWNEVPDYAPSEYDQCRVDQRHDMLAELLTALGEHGEVLIDTPEGRRPPRRLGWLFGTRS